MLMPKDTTPEKQPSEFEKIYLKNLLDRHSKSEENLSQALRAAGITLSVLSGFIGYFLLRRSTPSYFPYYCLFL